MSSPLSSQLTAERRLSDLASHLQLPAPHLLASPSLASISIPSSPSTLVSGHVTAGSNAAEASSSSAHNSPVPVSAEAAMYSSRQIPLFSPALSAGGAAGAALQQTDIRIDDVKLHAVPRLSDSLGAELSYYDNVFQRTKMGRIARPRGAAAGGGTAGGATRAAAGRAAASSSADQRTDNLAAKSLSVAAEAVTYNQLIHDNEAVLLDIVRRPGLTQAAKAFVRAGPRAKICWAEGEVVAAIVTCGGLCPGLNDVIAELFHTLYYGYGVDRVYGIRSGFRGFHDSAYGPWMELLPEAVKGIYEQGGTVLGSSRGGFDISRILAACRNRGVNQLYIIGGDGTHRAANALYLESRQRRLKLTVAGIPKTIDNDIGVIDRSFGFNTAVAEARKAIQSAVVEASCAPRGLGIVQLMGRHAGYIAAHATLASRQVDLCLIPEVPFPLEGELGLLMLVEQILDRQSYGVIVVAEGAGADLLPPADEKDESGNQRLPEIGKFLQQQIQLHFRRQHKDVSIKYHDPSYMIRSVPADAGDSVYCMTLAQNAVHGCMAGYTGFTSALVNNRTVMLPIPAITATSPSYLNPAGRTWERVVSLTHQPMWRAKQQQQQQQKHGNDHKEQGKEQQGKQRDKQAPK